MNEIGTTTSTLDWASGDRMAWSANDSRTRSTSIGRTMKTLLATKAVIIASLAMLTTSRYLNGVSTLTVSGSTTKASRIDAAAKVTKYTSSRTSESGSIVPATAAAIVNTP